MTPNHFKAWRKALGLSQKGAADALGLKNRIVQYYEKGERDGEKVKIPKHVRLACYALSVGVGDYHGPDDTGPTTTRGKQRRKRKRTEEPAQEAAVSQVVACSLDSGLGRTTLGA